MPQKRNAKKTSQADRAPAQANPLGPDMSDAPRAAQAMRLRRLGYTYAEIADRCGYKEESGARKAVKRASSRIIRDEAREYIGWQLDQLDAALSVVMEAIAKRDKGSLWAVDRLVPLLKRQSELMGLDAPKADSANAQQMLLVAVEAPILEAI